MIFRHIRTLATLVSPLSAPVERLLGRWHGSRERGSIVFAGLPETAEFIAAALIRIEQRESLGSIESPLDLRGRRFEAFSAGADLSIAEVPPLWRPSLPRCTAFRMPAWVSQELLASQGSPLVLPAAIRKEVQRHARRERYAVGYSDEERDLRRFYEGYYRPYISARFGSGAVLVDESRFLAEGRGMTLAMLRAGGEWTAGLLFRRRGNVLSLGWFGSATMPARAGASEVLDALVIEAAASQGVRRVILGHSRPSLADGVVRYKARFGAVIRPTRFPQRIIGIGVRRESPALAAAIHAAGLIAFRGGDRRSFELGLRPTLSADSRQAAPST
jgi:hypothetical protein